MKSSKSALAGLIRFLPLMGERVTARPNSAGPPAGRGNGSRAMVLLAVLLGLIGLNAAAQQQVATNSTAATPSRSTTIALTSDETRLVVVNREANSVSIIQVKDAQGNDVAVKLAEIGV